MPVTVKEIVKAFRSLFGVLQNKSFQRTMPISTMKEQKIIPIVRAFLLGWFRKSIQFEVDAILPWSSTGRGRIDFRIGNIAVEFVVRGISKSQWDLKPEKNLEKSTN